MMAFEPRAPVAPLWDVLGHAALVFLAFGGFLFLLGIEEEEKQFGLRVYRRIRRIFPKGGGVRICIDAREIRDVETGVGRYAFSLVREIARLDRHNEYLLLRRASYPRPIVVQPNFTDIAVPFGISTGRNLLGGARVVNPLQADIYHCLFHLLPLGVCARRIVLTLHDLIWINYPDIAYEARWRGWMARRFAGPWIGSSVRKAHHVITVSETTRQDALARYPGPPSRFTVIHHGSDGSCADNDDSRELPDVCRGRRFIFSLGNTKPYKNIRRLIEAFGQVSKAMCRSVPADQRTGRWLRYSG